MLELLAVYDTYRKTLQQESSRKMKRAVAILWLILTNLDLGNLSPKIYLIEVGETLKGGGNDYQGEYKHS